MFTKSDLRENDWVVLRNGEVFRVVNFVGKRVLASDKHHVSLHCFTNELYTRLSNINYDVMKVIRPTAQITLCRRHYSDGNVVFDRKKGIGCASQQFSAEERNHLKTLLAIGVKFIARDKSGELWMFIDKPEKYAMFWSANGADYFRLPDELFPQITWEDEEPFNIQDYLESECSE